MKTSTILALMLVLATAALAVAADGAPAGVVNINTATAEQLQLLPRVGPALAARIIDFREANGAFRSVDEIVAVKGIGEAALERLRPYLATSGATTLGAKVRSPRNGA